MFGRSDITTSGLGWVKYKGKIHQEDILILSDGSVLRRDFDEVRRKYGTVKSIAPKEIKLLLEENPEVIVIGVGHNEKDSLKIPAEVIEIINKSPSRIVQGLSPKACKYFDQLNCKKAALIHAN